MDDILNWESEINHIPLSGDPSTHYPTEINYISDTGDQTDNPIDNNPPLDDEIYQPIDRLIPNLDSSDSFSIGDGTDIFSNCGCGIVYPPNFFTFDDQSIMIGDQNSDMNHWHHQALPDSCAIVCQEYILHSFFPEGTFSEFQLVELAGHEGYYLPDGGTLPSDVGRVLEHYGIEVERSQGNSVVDIINKLENNQKIIVGVDANEIWANNENEQLKDLYFFPEANHAVQVIGYNHSQKEFILNDPGHPNGNSFHVSKSDFEAAWQDSNNFMMVTKNAPPMT